MNAGLEFCAGFPAWRVDRVPVICQNAARFKLNSRAHENETKIYHGFDQRETQNRQWLEIPKLPSVERSDLHAI
jgi:hypothetical protein